MSENLKRAESLFNRIMNQNGGPSTGAPKGNGNLKPRHYNNSNNNHNNSNNNNSINNHHNNHNNHNNSHNNNNHSNNHHGDLNGHHHYKNGYKSYNNGHTRISNIPNPNIELPKKDPAKTAEETLNKIPSDHHVLPYCWTIWHHSRAKPKQREAEEDAAVAAAVAATSTGSEESGEAAAVAVNSYLQTTNEIEFPRVDNPNETTTNIGSLEQMWSCLASLKKTYELPIGTELLIFKSGVNPVWEDPINTKGGRWVFRFSRRLPNNGGGEPESSLNIRKKLSLIWERLILKTMTGSIIPDSTYSEEIQDLLLNDISGLVLSVRKDEDIISIWNSNLNFNKKKSKEETNLATATIDDKSSKKLTSFQARRIICDSILRIIRECKMISRGSDSVETLDSGSNERVYGVSFEYRLHSDNNNPLSDNKSGNNGNGGRRYPKQLYINKSDPQTDL